jgi:hypothetical protein
MSSGSGFKTTTNGCLLCMLHIHCIHTHDRLVLTAFVVRYVSTEPVAISYKLLRLKQISASVQYADFPAQ